MHPIYLERPSGTRDLYGQQLQKKRWIEQQMIAVFRSFGYDLIETPMIEYVETFAQGLHGSEQEQLYRLFDRRGRTLALRPEMTTPVARVVATEFAHVASPLRLSYAAKTYRAEEGRLREPVEVTQAGIELIGALSPDADAEVIALMATALKRLGIEHFRFAIGHMAYLQAMLAPLQETLQARLRQALIDRDLVRYEQILAQESDVDPKWLESLREFPRIRGGLEAIDAARELALDERAEKACDEWSELFAALDAYGVAELTHVDLGLYLDHDYYTGIVIEGYADVLGVPICFGGRYDGLLERFGRGAPATGCVAHVERLLQTVEIGSEQPFRIHLCYLAEQRTLAFSFAAYLRERDYAVATSRVEVQELPSLEAQSIGECFGMFTAGGELLTEDSLLQQIWEYYRSSGASETDGGKSIC
ncbi:ATP phosphoribosyltransferase regulatory subunit [Sulfoacidibacillus thermotolerans]|uniref:ATP phosphoribosyltransferase regulatory subunit n=1 Tax=Sulfoacidibacillus thermotolerans TaxID=1765684 RepID=A0A2U3D8N7_SULT2|nr:ATP phosphoribosyltransferase regulatory subunit [Sulfoacidibacillus thermotolerans]PWI57635.1 ATP phosphoribosyltransferase regulatory subunit [Sulfoacidibacillus thermotolerans]